MPCPNCDHTFHSLGKLEAQQELIYWCPRCGTMRRRPYVKDQTPSLADLPNTDETPLLVERSRKIVDVLAAGDGIEDVLSGFPAELLQGMLEDPSLLKVAHRIGFIESCLLPEDRPSV